MALLNECCYQSGRSTILLLALFYGNKKFTIPLLLAEGVEKWIQLDLFLNRKILSETVYFLNRMDGKACFY